MKVRERKGDLGRKVLVGMVTSRRVLGAVAEKWDGKLFPSKAENLIAGWAVGHWRKYRKAPGRAVETYFSQWATDRRKDKDTIEIVEKFLESLSDESARVKSLSPEYLLELSVDVFNTARLRTLREELDGMIEAGEPGKGWEAVEAARKVEIGTDGHVKVLSASDELREAFETKDDGLIKFGQVAIDNFFATLFGRGMFVSFQGPEKSGKSFFLQEMAWQGVRNGRNVAFFEVGDQTRSQIMRRLAVRAARKPIRPERSLGIPLSMEPGSPPAVRRENKTFREGLTHDDAARALARVGKKYGEDRFRLSVHPNTSVTVNGIDTILEGWARDDWTPSVIIIDYADILAPLSGKGEPRDQINETWKAMRRLSQDWDCLLFTATQSNKDSYHKRTQDRSNYSEDKRKNGHVSAMLGINQTGQEKDAGLIRLNIIEGRDLDFSPERCLWLATCLPLANPMAASCL